MTLTDRAYIIHGIEHVRHRTMTFQIAEITRKFQVKNKCKYNVYIEIGFFPHLFLKS